MACRDNARTLPAVLEGVETLDAAEFIALDSGSTDDTVALLEAAGVRVERVVWQGHVRTKQAALDQARQPWTLLVDSDEPPTPELAAAIRALIEANDPTVAGARMNRRVVYRGKGLRHAWQPEWRLRLFRTGRGVIAGEDPHDRVEIIPLAGSTPAGAGSGMGPGDGAGPGRVVDLSGDLLHLSFETFAEHLAAQQRLATSAAASMHRDGRRTSPVRAMTSAVGAFIKQAVIKGGWRDGPPGLLAALSSAAGTLMKHTILYESQQGESADRASGG